MPKCLTNLCFLIVICVLTTVSFSLCDLCFLFVLKLLTICFPIPLFFSFFTCIYALKKTSMCVCMCVCVCLYETGLTTGTPNWLNVHLNVYGRAFCETPPYKENCCWTCHIGPTWRKLKPHSVIDTILPLIGVAKLVKIFY